MKEQFDDFPDFIKEELDREGDEIEQMLKDNPEVAAIKADDNIKNKIDRKIETYEEERQRKLISILSVEEQEALAVGRKVIAREARAQKGYIAKRRKNIWKRLGAAAAVVVLVLTLGITGVGGPKRLVEVMCQAVGSREITQIESDNDQTLKSGEDEEEKAYQQIKDQLGIEPVKLIKTFDSLKFKQLEIDQYIQMAHIVYENGDTNISYIINLSFTDESWGIDIEDQLINEYTYLLPKTKAVIREYKLSDDKGIEYVASFQYQEVYYHLVGVMNKKEFEEILNNLHFI